jgi:hypothetical protein
MGAFETAGNSFRFSGWVYDLSNTIPQTAKH